MTSMQDRFPDENLLPYYKPKTEPTMFWRWNPMPSGCDPNFTIPRIVRDLVQDTARIGRTIEYSVVLDTQVLLIIRADKSTVDSGNDPDRKPLTLRPGNVLMISGNSPQWTIRVLDYDRFKDQWELQSGSAVEVWKERELIPTVEPE